MMESKFLAMVDQEMMWRKAPSAMKEIDIQSISPIPNPRFPFLLHILKTPHFVLVASSALPLPCSAARKPCAKTRLVCAGGITPSSHRRAEEKRASLSRSMRAFRSGSANADLPTVSMTEASCSEPMTLILALGHIQRKRGE